MSQTCLQLQMYRYDRQRYYGPPLLSLSCLRRKDSSLAYMWFFFVMLFQVLSYTLNGIGAPNLGAWWVKPLVTQTFANLWKQLLMQTLSAKNYCVLCLIVISLFIAISPCPHYYFGFFFDMLSSFICFLHSSLTLSRCCSYYYISFYFTLHSLYNY